MTNIQHAPFSGTDTNFCFTPGKLTILADQGAGSSGKGKLGAFVASHADNWQFACNTFAPQAGHWVKNDDGKTYFYQTFNSCAWMSDRYEKLYIGPGSTIELAAFWKEKEQNNIPSNKIGISPLASILQSIDGKFERGLIDFDGNDRENIDHSLAKTGTTAHGCGVNRARRVLRRPEAKYARDVPELEQFICDVPCEIMDRLDRGQAGILEIAQGFQLSYLLPDFFPYTTSRNCTVAAALDDMMLPVVYAGNVILNSRTFPIRISSMKYIGEGGKHLTWDEIQKYKAEGRPYEIFKGNSGPGYDDQEETTWEDITTSSGSPAPIMEMTSVTKLPRRVFTFSRKNIEQSIRHNNTGANVYLALNFANYVDYSVSGMRKTIPAIGHGIPSKLVEWLAKYYSGRRSLKFIGTGALTDDYIMIGRSFFGFNNLQ
jgi:adenylosuccinate synthase